MILSTKSMLRNRSDIARRSYVHTACAHNVYAKWFCRDVLSDIDFPSVRKLWINSISERYMYIKYSYNRGHGQPEFHENKNCKYVNQTQRVLHVFVLPNAYTYLYHIILLYCSRIFLVTVRPTTFGVAFSFFIHHNIYVFFLLLCVFLWPLEPACAYICDIINIIFFRFYVVSQSIIMWM